MLHFAPPLVEVCDRINGSFRERRKVCVCVCVCVWWMGVCMHV